MKQKKTLSVSLIQASPEVGNISANLKKISNYCKAEKNSDLIVFPELFLTGYLCKDELVRVAVKSHGDEMKKLGEIAKEQGKYLVLGAPVVNKNGQLHNSSLLVHPDGKVDIYNKWYLPNFLPFEEKLYFNQGKELPVFDTEFGKIGLLICYDIFFPELSTALSLKGADIIICISASPTFSRRVFETVIPARAIENTVFFLYDNLTGTEESLTFWGGASVISPKGTEIAKGERFKEQAVSAVLDLRELEIAREGRPVLRDKRRKIFEELSGHP